MTSHKHGLAVRTVSKMVASEVCRSRAFTTNFFMIAGTSETETSVRGKAECLPAILRTDFLSDTSQRIKFASECFSEWGPVPAGVQQGTKLGPLKLLFVLMINDLDTNA